MTSAPVASARSSEAAIFDLFGTLVSEFPRSDFYDTVRAMGRTLGVDGGAFERAWDDSALGRQTGEYASVAANIRGICDELGVIPAAEAVERAVELRSGLYGRWFHPRAGALETLRELKLRGYPVGLVSMCAPDTPDMWRGSPLAPFVDVAVFSSESGLRKPEPAIYLAATDALGVEPWRCIYCGDGAYGELSGARSVGMTTYLIRDPAMDPADGLVPEREEDWDGASVADLRELLELFPR